MPLIGIIAKKKDVNAIKRELNSDIELLEITEESISNFKNIKFDEIICIEDINIKKEAYKYLSEMISKVKYLIINADVGMEFLKELKIKEPMKLITYGFNSKATITISSVKEDKIIICIQRNIEKPDKEIIETEEKEIQISKQKTKKIYNNLVVFIIERLNN